MDELIDLLDTLDVVADASDLADAGVDLADLASQLDLSQFDASLVESLSSLSVDDPFDVLEQLRDVAESSGSLTGAMEGVMPNGEIVELFVPSAENANELAEFATNGLNPDLLGALGTVSTDGVELPEGVLGEFNPSTGDIFVDGSHPQSWVTLNHEVGHAVFEGNPALKDELSSVLASDGFMADQAGFLELYPEQLRASEACAEAMGRFRYNPLAFQAQYPAASRLLARLFTR